MDEQSDTPGEDAMTVTETLTLSRIESYTALSAEERAAADTRLTKEVHALVDKLVTGSSLDTDVPLEGIGDGGRLGMAVNTAVVAPPLTVAAILVAGKMLKDMLENFASQLGAQMNNVVSGASAQLSLNMAELERMVGDKVTRPITDLGFDAQMAARRLQMAIEQLNRTLERQRQCIVADLHLFLAGVQTLTEILKRGVLFVKEGAPRVTHFEFADHSTAVVPPEGGRATITGFNLWSEKKDKPRIQLMDERRQSVIAELEAERGQSDDEVTCYIEGDLIQAHAAEVLDLHLRVTHDPGPFHTKQSYDLYVPMVMPTDDFRASIVLEATVVYTYETDSPARPLEPQWFYGENTDTSNDKPFGPEARVVVGDDSPCRIIKVDQGWGGIARYVKWANATFTQTSVTCQGLMDDAADVLGKLTSHSVFQYWVKPWVVCRESHTHQLSGRTEPVRVSGPELQLTLDLLKVPGHSFAQSDVEFVVKRILPGAPEVEVCRSQRVSAGSKGMPIDAIQAGRQTFTGYYTPGVASDRAQVAVKVATGSCGH
jgi:hypothetical protein